LDTETTEKVAQKCITQLARQYVGRLPLNSKHEYEDLTQEGWIVYWRLVTAKRTRTANNAEFAAVLRQHLKWRYNNIVREEYQPARARLVFTDSIGVRHEEALATDAFNPERHVELKQALGAIRKANNGVAYYLIFGLDAVEFGFLRYLQRERKQSRWSMNGMRYRWTPETVKLFFGFDAEAFPIGVYI
jgi:hypothetical protein